MTDIEDLIIDQLYFVTPFKAIANEVDIPTAELGAELWLLISKGWVKCFTDPEHEVQVTKADFDNHFTNYHYLASKKGLLEHNRR
jgi:hypothetical protein